MMLFKGLMKTKTCTTSVEMAKMMVPLISEQLTITAEVTTELLVQLSVYFAHTGIHNKEFLAFMTNFVDWPRPHAFATPTQKINLISIPVTLLLSKIARYAVALQEKNCTYPPESVIVHSLRGLLRTTKRQWITKIGRIKLSV